MSKVAKTYSEISLETSVSPKDTNPIELIIMVFEKTFDHLTRGKKELEIGKNGVEYFSKAVDLLNMGLIASLNKEKGGQIAENLELIYLCAIQNIVQARLQKKPEMIDEAIKVLRPIFLGWCDLKLKGM